MDFWSHSFVPWAGRKIKNRWHGVWVEYQPPIFMSIGNLWGFPSGASGKEPICQWRRYKRFRLDAWVGKIPWKRAWQPTPVFLPGEFRRQTEEPDGLQFMESQRVGQDWVTNTHSFYPNWQWWFSCYIVYILSRLLFPSPGKNTGVGCFSFSRSSQPRDQICVSCIAGTFSTSEPPRKPKLGIM